MILGFTVFICLSCIITLYANLLHSNCLALTFPEHEILYTETRITGGLEEPTKLERPRHAALRQEKERHLEHITNKPVDQHAKPKAFARAIPLVRHDLWQRQGRLSAKSKIALYRGVRVRRPDGNLQQNQSRGVVTKKLPVGPPAPPLPEIERPVDVGV